MKYLIEVLMLVGVGIAGFEVGRILKLISTKKGPGLPGQPTPELKTPNREI